jgi:hypothetical protein
MPSLLCGAMRAARRPPLKQRPRRLPQAPLLTIAPSAVKTGEIEDITTEDGKNAVAVALGRMGGKARAVGMSKKRRAEIAKKAAAARWRPR